MGQRTLAFTKLLLRNFSCNSLGKRRLLVVYAKKSFIQCTWGIQMNNTPNICNRIIIGSTEVTIAKKLPEDESRMCIGGLSAARMALKDGGGCGEHNVGLN
jgi:hypothetical protein